MAVLAIHLGVALLAAIGFSGHQHGSSSENQVQGSLRSPAPPGKPRYYYTAESADFQQAKRTCANIYGKDYGLAAITEPEDLTALKNYLDQNVSPGTELWIGGAYYEEYQEQKAKWVWDSLADPVTDEPLPFAPFVTKLFKPGQYPPNSVSRAVFTMMSRNIVWITHDKRTSTRRFVCEFGKGIRPSPCLEKTDISVVLDSSGSISTADYAKAKEGAANIVRSFALYKESRQQFLIYSDQPQEILSLLYPGSLLEKWNAIVNAPYLARSTNTAAAILKASQTLTSNQRPDAPRAMVVITDGGSNNPAETKKQAEAAKANGIKMVAVGVGSSINKVELNNIASSPDKVFLCNSWTELPRILEAISQSMCPKN